MAQKAEKHPVFIAKTPISPTQTPQPDKIQTIGVTSLHSTFADAPLLPAADAPIDFDLVSPTFLAISRLGETQTILKKRPSWSLDAFVEK